MKPLHKRIERLEHASGKSIGRVISLINDRYEQGFETIELAMEAVGLTPQPNDFLIITNFVAAENGRPKIDDLPDRYNVSENSLRDLKNNQGKIK